MSPTPFGLNPEENPDPSSRDFQKLHGKYPTLEVVEVIEMRRELEAPGAAEEKVHENDGIVDLLGVEEEVPTQSPRVLRVIALSGGGKHREIPIFGDIPIE